MRWWYELIYLVRKLNRKRAAREAEEEVRIHLEIETREQIEAGFSAEEARYRARRAFGSVALAREESRVVWGWARVQCLFDDLRYGLRMLRKSPGWSGVMVATLALGIGLTTAIFSLSYSVLLRALPYPDPERLVTLSLTNTTAAALGHSRISVNSANWLEWRAQSALFEDI